MGAISNRESRTLTINRVLNRWLWSLGSVSRAELRYQAIFDAAVARSGIPVPPLFPVASAANASFLYLLLRLCLDFPTLNMLEIGAGQTSLLLDALRKAGRIGSLVTIDHDPHWAAVIGGQVGHELRQVPLLDATLFDVGTQTYDIAFDRRFDCVIVDGPVGAPTHSRWGTLKLLSESLADEFIVIFDDAERPGEQQTIERFLELKPHAGHVFLHAAKSQCLVFTPAFLGARYYSDR